MFLKYKESTICVVAWYGRAWHGMTLILWHYMIFSGMAWTLNGLIWYDDLKRCHIQIYKLNICASAGIRDHLNWIMIYFGYILDSQSLNLSLFLIRK